MSTKKSAFIFLLVLALAVMLINKCNGLNDQSGVEKSIRKRGFDRRISELEYTQHARCRMECRKISQNDIQDIMRSGEINY